ncbi:zinc finger protein 292b [Ictalurus punctatus]|uniref:Zinc finger protein 292b n=1 Tax=Ictalurus punctatus TaxID=7998 RepID=A0A2D0PLI3_ICTPU|nr:zinc finger protein 292b [Ictalurus punctatus]
MADDEEAEQEPRGQSRSPSVLRALSGRLEDLSATLRASAELAEEDEATARYCRAFCQTLVECVSVWRSDEDPWPVLESYRVALLSFARVSAHLSVQSEDVNVVLERLSLSCVELLLSIPEAFPDALWEQFQSSIQTAHALLQDHGITRLRLLSAATQERGMWSNSTLQSLLRNETPPAAKVREFLMREGPELLQLRVKYLIKENSVDMAALLAKACADFHEFGGSRGHFKQSYLVCVCSSAPQEMLMEELSQVDCRDALEMICNLEAEGDERGAFTLCSGFLTRQLLQEDSYCAWELTLFWSKLLKRLEPSEQSFLEKCQKMSQLAKTVFHLLFFIKVIQSELDKIGLPTCIEMCIRALRMESCEGANKATICKTISCLLPSDLEVKRACQLTEFLLEPTVDSYYAVETLYNEPDQKLEEENLPIPNSLRCDLFLVFKTQWPFDPEFWDWKTLKRHCLGLMGEEASIVSSIDELNDDRCVEADREDLDFAPEEFKDVFECFLDTTNELKEIADQRQKNREVKKLREKGFVSARFRNWQAYMQYCVLCDKEFLGHRIVRHAQTHFRDGYYSCPICTETFETRETLEPHVASHVKLSCKERLASMKTTKKLTDPKTPDITALRNKSGENQARKAKAKTCNGESVQLYNGDAVCSQSEVTGVRVNGRERNVCPVPNCRKGFKFFRNLLTHVKDHGEVEEAKRFLELQTTKIVCQYCRRHFVSVSHLNDHLQVHCGAKPYTCIQVNCKASFDTNAELLVHSKGHPVFKAKCMFPGCGKTFNEAYKLYDHEAQHYKTFTCKVPGCGKVFHAQSQLELHEESHNAQKVETQTAESNDARPVEPQPPISGEPAKQEVQQDVYPGPPVNPSCMMSPADHPTSLVKVKHSVENMLRPAGHAPTQAFGLVTCKTEPPDPKLVQQQQSPPPPQIPRVETQQIPRVETQQIPRVETQQIPRVETQQIPQPPVNPPMPHLNEPRPEDSLLDALMNDPMLTPSCPLPPASSYQSLLEDFQQAPSGDVLQAQMESAVSQGHTQPLYSSENAEYGQYDPNPVTPIHTPYPVPYGNSMVPLMQTAHNVPPVMPVSQRLPAQVTPFPTNRPVQPLQANTLGSAVEDKDRYKCAYETCSRDYSSYRSLTKHMKAAHCEFYTQWKLARRNNKVPSVTSRPASMNGKRVPSEPLQNQLGQRTPAPLTPMQKPPAQVHYPASCLNSSYPSGSSHLTGLPAQTFPNQMDSILDPIVLSQLGNAANQPDLAPHASWNSVPMNSSLQQQNYHPQAMTSSVGHFSSQMDVTSQSQVPNTYNGEMGYPSFQHQNNPSCRFFQTRPDVTVTTNNLAKIGHPNGSSPPHYVQQPKPNSIPVVKHTECVVKLERNTDLVPSPPNMSQQSNPPAAMNSQTSQDDTGGSSSHDSDVKKRKRSSRTKWPAIIKDGKFICCRCFREFQSPKSLGGHLSKRAVCKPYDEAVLSADLPSSFLELLNSPHLSDTPQSSPSAQVGSAQTWPSLSKGPLDPKLFPNVTFLNTKDSTYNTDSKPSSKSVQQNSPSLAESVGARQQAFAESSLSYLQDSQSSVIQHTGNIKDKRGPHQMNYSQSRTPLPSDTAASDQLLSRLLSENQTSDSDFSRSPTNPIDRILQAETLNKIKEIKDKSTITNASGLSNDGLLAAMASLAQNLVSEKSVKERLREQILAGDFQKRTGLCQGQGVENSALQSPAMDVSHHSTHVIQKAHHSNEPVRGGGGAELGECYTSAGSIVPDETSRQIPPPCASDANLTNDAFNNPPVQQHDDIDDEITEIQKALERLDLDREIRNRDQTPVIPVETEGVTKPSEATYALMVRGYSCDNDGCGYRAMTKDALFKHLMKQHNYTEDMLNQCRKEQSNFAPFNCQLCPKTFTRNSNLRTHYQSVHNYSHEQVVKMGITRHYSRKSSEADQSLCTTSKVSDLLGLMVPKAPFSGQRQHAETGSVPGLIPGVGSIKTEFNFQPFKQQLPVASVDPGVPGTILRAQTIPDHLQSQTTAHASVIKAVPALLTSSSVEQQLNRPNGFVPGSLAPSHTHGMLPGGLLPSGAPPVAQSPSVSAQVCNLSPDKKSKLGRSKMPKPKEVTKKAKEKKMDLDDVFSPYRPYRCVHQGCVAAFTIQHNLILHYKAVHQSALPKFEVNDEDEQMEEENEENEENEEENDTPDGEVCEVTEFRCQVKDCSRIFQAVTDLLQHYLQLHKLSLDKAGVMMSGMNLGRFRCDQPDCEVTFTGFWKYVNHVESEHKKVKLSRSEPVDGMFQCEVEGCSCVYTTRSNLLRHIMKKHQDLYKLRLLNSRGVRLGRPPKNSLVSLEKENREIHKKPIQKGGEKKRRKQKNLWTKYGNPILKTKEEASAMCTKRIQLQYPCMLKGCETVAESERRLMKHYVQHGLPKQYLEQQRSNYIFCKKMARSKYKRIASRSDDTDKSDESSIEASENEGAGPSESEFSKPTSEKESTEDTEVSDAKLSSDLSSDISVVVKRKRGRPRKGERVKHLQIARKRVTRLRAAQNHSVNYADINSDSASSGAAPPERNATLSSFKPMGFEVSFLKFLEESSQSAGKRKTATLSDLHARRKFPTVHLKTASVVCSRINPDHHCRDVLKLVEFKNPQKLTSLSKVTFEVHRGFSNVFELLLKQLHDMRPAVVIQKEGVSDIKG